MAPVLVLALCACGAQPAPGSASPAVVRSSGSTPVPPGAGTEKAVIASDADNGRVLTLHVGQQLRLVLSSTYWNVVGSSDTAVLRQAGAPAVSPQRSGCVPGSGCGTVTALFDAVAPGRSDVSATRTTCGEAAGCTGGSAAFRLTVVVAA